MHIRQKDNGCQQECELMSFYGTDPQCDEWHEGIIKKWDWVGDLKSLGGQPWRH